MFKDGKKMTKNKMKKVQIERKHTKIEVKKIPHVKKTVTNLRENIVVKTDFQLSEKKRNCLPIANKVFFGQNSILLEKQ